MLPISSVFINFLIFIAIGFAFQRKNFQFKGWSTFFKFVLLSGLSWLLLTAVGYPFIPVFLDHAESNIAAVAANWLQGHSIYTVVGSAEQYSLLYGPLPYLVSALFEGFGSQAIFLSKLTGLLNLSIVLIGFVVLLKKLFVSKQDSVFTLGLLALCLLGFYNISYWNRPDSYIMAALFLTVLVIEFSARMNPWWVYISVGLLAGIATNCKLHAVIYFVPLCAYFLEAKKLKIDVLETLTALAVFLAVFVLPFLIPQVGGENYFEWLKMASKHGLVLKDMIKIFTFVLTFLVLLGILGFGRKYRVSFWILGATCFLIAVIASKPGAGVHHFLPLVPVMIWWAVKEYFTMPRADQKSVAYVVAALILTIGIYAVNRQMGVYKFFTQSEQKWSEFADLKTVVGRYTGKIELGYAGRDEYPSTLYKAWLVHNGHGLLFESASLMDFKTAGMQIPSASYDLISSCAAPTMVFPKGSSPWTLVNFYDDTPLFGAEFAANFEKHYQLVETSDYFVVYRCK